MLVGGCRCASSLYDLDLTFGLAVVTLTLKFCPGYISISWCDLDLTFELVVVTMSFKIFSRLFWDSIRCRRFTLGRDIG